MLEDTVGTREEEENYKKSENSILTGVEIPS
jgi:hypothetical protein